MGEEDGAAGEFGGGDWYVCGFFKLLEEQEEEVRLGSGRGVGLRSAMALVFSAMGGSVLRGAGLKGLVGRAARCARDIRAEN